MSRRTTLLLLLALSAGHAQAANLVASVDRNRLNSGETVELTVESGDVTQFGKPDLSPLDAQFEVSGTRQINQLTTLGGDNHATTRWIITLLPKENGTVVIPPLQVGEYKTQPISLQVVETASQNTAAAKHCSKHRPNPRTHRTATSFGTVTSRLEPVRIGQI